jgi:lipopolysaccharide/colanic/teichoic acid biosynthesis glycosyltransferase
MDSARLDTDPSAEGKIARTHTSTAPEAIGHTAIGGAQIAQRVRDAHSAHLVHNGSGAGTVALPYGGTLGDLAPADWGFERPHGLAGRAVKRTIDVVGALLLLIVLAPFWLMIALLIKADSAGPIFFRQRRVGRDGEAFSMFKFRTMVDGADAYKPALMHLNEAAEGLFKIDGDPRVTSVGRWLRSTSLDELPQLLHVVSGKMSLVGPRPLVPDEDVRISGGDRARLAMRPGMTGVWQVGGASSIPIHEMVRLDRGYLEDWSLWLDVKLLLQTAGHVVLRKGL